VTYNGLKITRNIVTITRSLILFITVISGTIYHPTKSSYRDRSINLC